MDITADRPLPYPETFTDGLPAARARIASAGEAPAVRVDLVWRDPVTNEELVLDLEATPGLVDRLLAAGFRTRRRHGDGSAAA